MPNIEALELSMAVVDLADHLRGDMQWRKREETNVELGGYRQQSVHILLEVVLVVAIPTQILRVVPHGFPELLGIGCFFAEAAWGRGYVSRVMSSLRERRLRMRSAVCWVSPLSAG
jgi:methyl coenzyme M reductase subunit C-like uncharacterized protein (methanogenesis marker protein 7)